MALNASAAGRDTIHPLAFWIAGIFGAALIAVTLAVLPFVDTQLPKLPPFYLMTTTAMCLVEGLTAFFLTVQFIASKDHFLGALAGAYAYVTITSCIQILAFPGIFTITALVGDSPNAPVWLWVIWHGGFPVLTGLALLTLLPAASQPALRYLGAGFLLGANALALLLGYLAVNYSRFVMPLVANGSFVPMERSFVPPMVIAANFVVLIAYLRLNFRRRNLLNLWLAVSLLANMVDAIVLLCTASRYNLGWYTSRCMDLVAGSIMLCVLVFDIFKLYQQTIIVNRSLSNRALYDGLTGALNRSYFTEHLPLAFLHATRTNTSLSLIMLDVDHFKKYNDTHGHQMGDECLIDIAGALKTALRRPADFLARYGGEEFAVVLPDTGREAAMQIAESLRLAVQNLAIPHEGTGGIVTISIGFATCRPATDSLSPEELLRRADLALYQAKHNGRDTAREFELEAA
jgi:diguanylate cyclase (GGDEF)-like protein